jgi:hypothetical protein
MKRIYLTQGYIAIVDDAEYARAIVGRKWSAQVNRRKDGSIKNVYAVRRNGKRTTEKLHRFILGVSDPAIQVDHSPDHSGLNCQRSNLRIATSTENNRNARLRVDSATGLKGVSFSKRLGKFEVSIKVDGTDKFLGYYASKYDAGRSYDAAALEAFGPFALTNQMLGLYPKRPTSAPEQLTFELQEA